MEIKGDVTDALAVLVELQSVDCKLREQQRSLANMSLTVSDRTKRVKEIEDSLAKEKDALKRLEMESSQRELDIKSHQEKVAKLRTQLNLVKNQKEYDALIHEITALQTDSGKAEDDALGIMTTLDEVRKGMDELQKELAAAREAVTSEQQKANAEIKRVGQDMRQLKSERDALVGRLDAEIRKKYERILLNKGERAISEVVGTVCQGCNMGVTKQYLSRLMARREIIQCPNCLRILYLKEEQ